MTGIRRPITVAAPKHWRDASACRGLGEDSELFFPVGEGHAAKAQEEQAKAVCRGCPVWQQCLVWALETRQDSGVWGGLSEGERRKLHRREARRNWRDGVTAAEQIVRDQLPQYQAAVAAGKTPFQIARELKTNVQTVNNVEALLADRQSETELAA